MNGVIRLVPDMTLTLKKTTLTLKMGGRVIRVRVTLFRVISGTIL